MFTLFRQRVGDVEVIIVEVQQLHCSIQSELGLLYLLRYSVHRDLTQQHRTIRTKWNKENKGCCYPSVNKHTHVWF